MKLFILTIALLASLSSIKEAKAQGAACRLSTTCQSQWSIATLFPSPYSTGGTECKVLGSVDAACRAQAIAIVRNLSCPSSMTTGERSRYGQSCVFGTRTNPATATSVSVPVPGPDYYAGFKIRNANQYGGVIGNKASCNAAGRVWVENIAGGWDLKDIVQTCNVYFPTHSDGVSQFNSNGLGHLSCNLDPVTNRPLHCFPSRSNLDRARRHNGAFCTDHPSFINDPQDQANCAILSALGFD